MECIAWTWGFIKEPVLFEVKMKLKFCSFDPWNCVSRNITAMKNFPFIICDKMVKGSSVVTKNFSFKLRSLNWTAQNVKVLNHLGLEFWLHPLAQELPVSAPEGSLTICPQLDNACDFTSSESRISLFNKWWQSHVSALSKHNPGQSLNFHLVQLMNSKNQPSLGPWPG